MSPGEGTVFVNRPNRLLRPERRMNAFTVCTMVLAAVALTVAEPPSGYSYNRPSGGSFGGSFGVSSFGGGSFGGGSFGGGHGGGHGGGLIGGGGYQAVSHGYQTSEGAQVDPQLLEQVRQILLKEELNSHSSGGGIGGGYPSGPSSSYGAPSSSYGVPSSSYGVPSYQQRVVGIDLEGVRQAIQVAQYHQASQSSHGGGYPSAPSGSYGAPSIPSGSYGAPY